MPKLSIKIGDIFQTKNTKNGRRILQFVAIDPINMSTDVIVVFKSDADEAQISTKEGANNSIEFYTHTQLSEGANDGLWEKIGNIEVLVDVSKLIFKNYFDEDEQELFESMNDPSVIPPVPFPNWTIWSPKDVEWHYVSSNEGKRITAEDGMIVPAMDIIHRIETGISRFKSNWPS